MFFEIFFFSPGNIKHVSWWLFRLIQVQIPAEKSVYYDNINENNNFKKVSSPAHASANSSSAVWTVAGGSG